MIDIQTVVIDNGTTTKVKKNKRLAISVLFIVLVVDGYSYSCFFRLGLLGMMVQRLFSKVSWVLIISASCLVWDNKMFMLVINLSVKGVFWLRNIPLKMAW